MKDGTHLEGLEGTNPLGFLAALGVQVLFDSKGQQPKLWWSDDIIPHAIVDPEYSIDYIVTQALEEFPKWLESPALNPGVNTKANDTAKFIRKDIRNFLRNTQGFQPGNQLASALVAEGILDEKGKVAKPTDLYFMAGQLKFLKVVREVIEKVTTEELENGLTGPWSYSSKLSSLGWDIVDDRIYALAPVDPAKDKKLSNPGVEALAIFGLSLHSVFNGRFRGRPRTLTLGCDGPWKKGGTYTWPLWTQPAALNTVRSLIAQATGGKEKISQRARWYPAWGISKVMQSVIHRSDPGGYGTFRPPQVIWSRG